MVIRKANIQNFQFSDMFGIRIIRKIQIIEYNQLFEYSDFFLKMFKNTCKVSVKSNHGKVGKKIHQ